MRQVPFGPVRFDVMQLKRKDRKTSDTLEELQEELDNTLTSVSGNPITISDASNTNAEDFTVTIVPTQAGTGTPSPDNVRAISGLSSVDVVLNDDTITFSLGSTVYGGTINFSTGVLTVNRKMYKFEGGSGESWAAAGPNSSGLYNFHMVHSGDISANKGICNRLPLQTSLFSETTTEGFFINPQNIFLRLSSSRASTVEELKTWLASNNIEVCGELATPTTTQLTAQQIRLLQGENELSTTGSSMSFKYQRDNLIGDLKSWVLDQLS